MPKLSRKIARTGQLIRAAGALAGLVLPTAALVSLGELPENDAKVGLIILPATSVVLILAIFIVGPRLALFSSRSASISIIALAVGGAICTAAFARTADRLVVERNLYAGGKLLRSDRDIKPLRPSRRIQDLVDYHGNYHRALKRGADPMTLRQWMNQENGTARALILFLMTLSQLLLVSAIVGGAWWLAETGGAERPRAAAKKARLPGAG